MMDIGVTKFVATTFQIISCVMKLQLWIQGKLT